VPRQRFPPLRRHTTGAVCGVGVRTGWGQGPVRSSSPLFTSFALLCIRDSSLCIVCVFGEHGWHSLLHWWFRVWYLSFLTGPGRYLDQYVENRTP